MEGLLKKVNDGIYAVERWIVVVSSIFMAIIVFFDVVARRYSSAQSRLIEKVGGWTGMDPEGSTYQSLQDVSSVIVWALTFGLVYFGIRSASRRPLFEEVEKDPNEEPIEAKKALGLTTAILIVCWLGLRLLFGNGEAETIIECPESYTWDCGIFPHGVADWAQPLALVCTLWLGFLGASMATRDHRHLKVEALQRFMPEKVQRVVGLVSALLTAGFCVLLALLAWRYVGYLHDDYVAADGLGALHDGVDIPRYQAFLIVPTAYLLMAARFVSTGVLAWRGELDTTPSEIADIDFGEGDDAGAESDGPPEDRSQMTTADDGPSFPPGELEALAKAESEDAQAEQEGQS